MILSTEQIKQLKNKETEFVFHNSKNLCCLSEQGDMFLLWYNSKFQLFVLEKNGKVIKATKTIKPILNKLELDKVITELTQTI